MGNGENAVNGQDIDINDWVIINSPGGRYLGRVAGSLNPSNLGGAADLKVEKFTPEGIKALKEKVLEAVSNGDCVELCPALDFLAPLRPVPGPQPGMMAMNRDPIIVPLDFTVLEVPVYVKGSSIYFLADLKGADRNMYKDFVRGGLQIALQARAAASGISLAGGPLPPQNGKVTPIRG